MTGFGWNFYGFFLFAIAWVALYFMWARWMARRAARTANGSSHEGTKTRKSE